MKTKEFGFGYLDYLSLKSQKPKPPGSRRNYRITGLVYKRIGKTKN